MAFSAAVVVTLASSEQWVIVTGQTRHEDPSASFICKTVKIQAGSNNSKQYPEG